MKKVSIIAYLRYPLFPVQILELWQQIRPVRHFENFFRYPSPSFLFTWCCKIARKWRFSKVLVSFLAGFFRFRSEFLDAVVFIIWLLLSSCFLMVDHENSLKFGYSGKKKGKRLFYFLLCISDDVSRQSLPISEGNGKCISLSLEHT